MHPRREQLLHALMIRSYHFNLTEPSMSAFVLYTVTQKTFPMFDTFELVAF